MKEVMYKYRHEAGMVVSVHGHGLHLVQGTTGSVDFPSELIVEINQKQPGIIHQLAHTHPPGHWELSKRDKLTLKSWAFALYPFPARMSVITWMPTLEYFNHMTAIALLETKESWIARKKESARECQIIIESNQPFQPDEYDTPVWLKTLVDQSYQTS